MQLKAMERNGKECNETKSNGTELSVAIPFNVVKCRITQCKSCKFLGNWLQLTTSTRDKCLPESTWDNCSPEITWDKCSSEITWDKCLPDSTRDNCVPEITWDNCLSEITWDNCLPESTWDNCLPESSWDNCLPESTREKAGDEQTRYSRCEIKYIHDKSWYQLSTKTDQLSCEWRLIYIYPRIWRESIN